MLEIYCKWDGNPLTTSRRFPSTIFVSRSINLEYCGSLANMSIESMGTTIVLGDDGIVIPGGNEV